MIFDLLASGGLMFILKYGTILNLPRNWVCRVPFFKELFKCSLCLGFWTGVAVMGFELCFDNHDYRIFLLPLMSAGCCWFFDNLNNVLQSIEIKLDKDLEK